MGRTSENKTAARTPRSTVKNQLREAKTTVSKSKDARVAPRAREAERRTAAVSGEIVSINVSEKKGVRKTNISYCELLREHGLSGDAHAGDWHRQVSLLAEESIGKMQELGLDVSSGDFAENITTRGLDLVSLPVGTKLKAGDSLLEVTQIGKVCHDRCAIYYQAGDCVMPREGIFCRVLKGGPVKVGDPIKVSKG